MNLEAVANGIDWSRFVRHLAPARIRELERALRDGSALPAHWRTDADLFAIERDAVLRRCWHYAGHAGGLSKVGDQIVQKIAGVPIVLLRDERNDIRGFVNICRHRAHLVVLENQSRRSMQCIYHGWTYGLDGRLRAAPRARTDPCFDEEQFPLLSIQVHQWGQTLWVNLDLAAPGFETNPTARPAAPLGASIEDCRHSFDRTWTIKANWKLFVDTFMERHCVIRPRKHQGLATWWLFGEGHTSIEGEQVPCCYHWLMPMTFIRHASDRRGFDIGAVRVVDVDRIEFRSSVFVNRDMSAETEARRRESCLRDAALDADSDLCERRQQTDAEEGGPPPPLSPASAWLAARLLEAVRQSDQTERPHDDHD